jgi:hypothetical protein
MWRNENGNCWSKPHSTHGGNTPDELYFPNLPALTMAA